MKIRKPIGEFRKYLKENPTKAEIVFFEKLKSLKIANKDNFRIRNQAIPSGKHHVHLVIDFLIRPNKRNTKRQLVERILAIEIDGTQHSQARDLYRDKKIQYPILHIPNNLAMNISWSELAGAMQLAQWSEFVPSAWLS